MTRTFTLKDAPIVSIPNLYYQIATLLGIDPETVKSYDCKKINVASNIADAVEQYYQDTYEEKLGNDWKQKFGMEWVCFGPKAIETLPENTIEVDEGFITT